MNELVKITANEKIGQSVSSKELYSILGLSPAHYNKWLKKNIEKNEFAIQDKDFSLTLRANNSADAGSRGRFAKEYNLSIEFAERLAMMCRSEKGEEVRRYFQGCRNKLREVATALVDPTKLSREELFRYALLEANRVSEEKDAIIQEKSVQIKQMQPLAEHAKHILTSTDTIPVTVIAKERGVSAQSLNNFLHEMGVQWKVSGQWVLKSQYQHKGYTKVSTGTYTKPDGQIGTTHHTEWTERGRAFIHWFCNKHEFGVVFDSN